MHNGHTKILVNSTLNNVYTQIQIFKPAPAALVKKCPDIPISPEPNICSNCKQIFTSRKRLWAHTQARHDIAGTCTECGKSYTSRKYLSSHTRDMHSYRTFKCIKCTKGFSSKGRLKTHITSCGVVRQRRSKSELIKKETKSIPLQQCSMCPKLLTSYNLRAHVREVHLAIRFKCKVCKTSFTRMSDLVRHSKKQKHLEACLRI